MYIVNRSSILFWFTETSLGISSNRYFRQNIPIPILYFPSANHETELAESFLTIVNHLGARALEISFYIIGSIIIEVFRPGPAGISGATFCTWARYCIPEPFLFPQLYIRSFRSRYTRWAKHERLSRVEISSRLSKYTVLIGFHFIRVIHTMRIRVIFFYVYLQHVNATIQ